MKVKKYPQSHLVISNGTSKIAIDPGMYTFQKGFKASEFSDCQAILVTHAHGDHLDADNIKAVAEGKQIFGNAHVVEHLKEIGVSAVEIKDQQAFEAGGFEITAIDLPHCKMADGSDGPPNTGFLIEGVLFHPGDGDMAPQGITSDNVALPIAGPSITTDGALKFAEDLEAKVVIPIHYDGKFPVDLDGFTQMAETAGIEVRPLKAGEETEV